MVEGVALESRDYLEYGEVITAELYISGSTLGLPARNSLEKHLFSPPFRVEKIETESWKLGSSKGAKLTRYENGKIRLNFHLKSLYYLSE